MTNRQKVLDTFLEKWPLSKLESLTLAEYAMGGDNYKDTFSYAVEIETKNLGDISGLGGGGAFKHGIYYMTNKKVFTGNKRLSDDEYAWLIKFGQSAEEAFRNVKNALLKVAKAAKAGDWERIDQVAFYEPVKWKWAFLYSNQQLITLFKKEMLEVAAKQLGYQGSEDSYPALYRFLLGRRMENENCFTQTDRLWNLYQENKPVDYYIIGSKYGDYADEDIFPQILEKSVVAVGFASEIDLEDYVGKYQNDIVRFLKEQGEDAKSYNCLKHFLSLKPGDQIAVKADGNPKGKQGFLSIVGLAEVIEKDGAVYEYDPQGLGHLVHVKYLQAPVYKEFDLGGYGRTIHRLSKPQHIDLIFKSSYTAAPAASQSPATSSKLESMPELSLNTIFFGPPGTGKTFNTINHALHLCGETTTGLTRKEVKAKFEQKVTEGQIVFTTFHQSMTYEDFVEGIKPMEPEKEGDPVIYKVVEGIFQKLCIEAAFSIARETESAETENVLDFSVAFDSFVQELEERLASEEEIKLVTKNGGKVLVDGISSQGNILIKHVGKSNIYPVSKQRLSKLHAAFADLNEVNNIDQEFRSIIGGSNSTANWSVLNAIRKAYKPGKISPPRPRDYTLEDMKEVVLSMKRADYKGKKGKPYVLIIDEINRGNVSQIFGELITLIEEDKRLGQEEALDVRLPYSKEKFGVPPNVYIIGTMNTADRSVEALDTALRRRFSFMEMAPKPALIKSAGKLHQNNGMLAGIDLAELLRIINKRIEKLVDKDHMIGHSYFLSVSTLNELKTAFQNKILPLLQEYFFGDHGKIGLVLGTAFFEESEDDVEEEFFAKFDYEASSLIERRIYHLRDVNKMEDEEFVSALNLLMRKAQES